MKNKWTKRQKRIVNAFRVLEIVIFAMILAVGSITGFLWFARPTKSILEKRDLTTFPAFSLDGFVDGRYFSDISTWYADTYPNRENFISMSNTLKSSYGVNIGAMVENNYVMNNTVKNGDEQSEDETVDVSEEIQKQIVGNLYTDTKKHAVYSLYYFNPSGAEWYAQNVNSLAENLDGITNVYSMLIPTNAGIVMDQKVYAQTGANDQKEALDYYYSQFSPKVKQVQVYDTLKTHKNQYIYFRTDHHWTSLGAYYAYKEFCAVKGVKPKKKREFEKYVFEPFIGTYRNEVDGLEEYPDKVTAYGPVSTNDMTFYDTEDTLKNGKVITDVSEWADSGGYYCFVNGDQPFAEIDNPEIEDGSSVLVIKDSYGNCFIPLLVDQYDKTYFMDFRNAKFNVVEFCKENNITDVIIENSIIVIGGDSSNAMFEELFN